ncbi:hypothetical protein [Trinickia dinghuensis]|uniref:Uncharacterized protein n=1 Tax=Trinickia dinghuensis TaxID=2291023 RepID=A0A3D8K1J7_9BURK|nr:hypothetical protein [Trinickia dinghuensis]RDU99188.1 hypothetical protein DWV00_08670 [Trinickia dinghuensis]
MATLEQILQVVVDHPGYIAAEIADELEKLGQPVNADEIGPRLKTYVDAGKVKREKKTAPSGREVWAYFPMQSLVDVSDGTKRIVTHQRGRRTLNQLPGTDTASSVERTCDFGFFSNGHVTIVKGNKEIKLDREETSRLLEFLDSINVERAIGA